MTCPTSTNLATLPPACPPPSGSSAEGDGLAASLKLSVCVICCASPGLPHDSIEQLVKAFTPVADVHPLILSAREDEASPRFQVIQLRPGTKLSKIRSVSHRLHADLVCICDPDLTIHGSGCRAVLSRAQAQVRAGDEVVAFGVVQGRDDGTFLSRVIAIDKWLSHRVLRRGLWSLGLGMTLPGQLLVVSPGLLRAIDPAVDSYLDDLYLGWVARRARVRVHRLPVVVGTEDPRTSWGSLLSQRLRWMRGLASLVGHLGSRPAPTALLAVHYAAYHGLPIAVMAGITALLLASPLLGLAVFLALAALLAAGARRPLSAAIAFLAVFPALHLVATLLWWVPLPGAFLTRR